MAIYIPTMGRIRYEQQCTARELEQYSTRMFTLVCPEDEVALHQPYQRGTVIGCPAVGIAATRNWIVQQCKAEICVMIDDDMYFYEREGNGPLVKHPPLDPMFQWIDEVVGRGYLHGGVSARQGNNRMTYPEHLNRRLERVNTRVNNFHFYHVPTIKGHNLYLDVLPVMEDFCTTLQLMALAHPNIVTYRWCWNQRGSGAEGGCSSYRTKEIQAEAAKGLQRLFPEHVKCITKINISESVGSIFREPRLDVNIQWRKAWDDRWTPTSAELQENA